MSFRQITAGDSALYLPLLSQMSGHAYEMTEEEFGRRLQKIESQGGKIIGGFLSRRSGEKLVCCGKILLEEKFGQPVAHLEDVVVEEKERRRGFGKALVEEALRVAREKGCYKLVLESAEKNSDFYAKCGLSQKGGAWGSFL